MKETADYKNYDYIKVAVKEKRSKDLENMYSAFLWEQIECKEHNRYYDVLNYTFRRSRKIDNKDELLYLQVTAESKFNEMDKRRYTKHAASTSLALYLSICAVALIGSGIAVLLLLSKIFYMVLGSLLIAGGVFASFLVFFLLPKLFKYENIRYQKLYIENQDKMKQIFLKVTELTGAADERNKEN